MKSKTIFLITFITTLIILSSIFLLFVIFKNQIFPQPIKKLPPIDFCKLEKNQAIIAKINPKKSSLTDIYLSYDLIDGKLMGTYKNVLPGIYHLAQFANNCSYVIRSEYTDVQNEEYFFNELWRIDIGNKADMIYTGKIVDIRISPNNNYLAIIDDRNLVILNQSTNNIKKFDYSDFNLTESDGQLQFEIWSKDSQALWIRTYFIDKPYFYKIKVPEMDFIGYETPTYPFDVDYSLNPNTGILAYSNFPRFYDADEYENYVTTKADVQLKARNLFTKQEILITQSQAKMFKPKWIDDLTIEYDNPNGDNRLQYNIPASLLLNQ